MRSGELSLSRVRFLASLRYEPAVALVGPVCRPWITLGRAGDADWILDPGPAWEWGLEEAMRLAVAAMLSDVPTLDPRSMHPFLQAWAEKTLQPTPAMACQWASNGLAKPSPGAHPPCKRILGEPCSYALGEDEICVFPDLTLDTWIAELFATALHLPEAARVLEAKFRSDVLPWALGVRDPLREWFESLPCQRRSDGPAEASA